MMGAAEARGISLGGGGGRGRHYFLVSADISPSAGSSKTTGFILRRRLGHEMLSGISCLHWALEFFQYFCCSEVFRYVYVYTIRMNAVHTVLHLQLLRIFLSLSVKLCSDYFDMQSCRHSVLSCGFSCFLFHTQFVFPAAGKASAGRNLGQQYQFLKELERQTLWCGGHPSCVHFFM